MKLDQKVFLSYTAEDKKLADLLKEKIELEFSRGITVFMYQDYEDNKPGDEWWKNIKDALYSSRVLLVLATPNSIKKPWINFEAGSASLRKIKKDKSREVKLLPLCAKGLSKKELGLPLNIYQALDMDKLSDVETLMTVIAENYGHTYEKHTDLKTIIKEATGQEEAQSKFDDAMNTMGVSNLFLREDLLRPEYGLKWKQLEQQCQKSIRVVGWSNMNVIDGKSRYIFKNLVSSQDRKLEWLIFDAEAVAQVKTLNFGPICTQDHETIVKDLRSGLEDLKEFYETLEPKLRKNIEVRETNWIMSWSAVSVDLTESTGLLQIELYTYNIGPETRPVIILYPKPGGFYEVCKESLDNMWSSAKVVKL